MLKSKIKVLFCSVLINAGLNPVENHKATKTAFNVGPSSVRQRNAIQMAFRWWAEYCPLLVVFGSSLSLSTKKRTENYSVIDETPSDKTFWICACLTLSSSARRLSNLKEHI